MERTTIEAATSRADQNAPAYKRHYASKAGWFAVGEWCDKRVAFAALGRKLSIGRKRLEERVG